MKSLSDRQTMNALADRLVEACEVIDRKDATIDSLRAQIARLTQDIEGCHAANEDLFISRANFARENLVLRADLAAALRGAS